MLGVEPQVIGPTVFANVANNVSGVLSGAATATDTTITLTPGGGALFPNAPFYASCEFEVLWVLSKSGDNLIVQRAMDGTTATTHAIGQIVEMRNNAGLWKDHSTAINNLESGVSSGTALPADVVYRDKVQEITHKTLDLTDPTKANVIIGTVSPDPSQLAYDNVIRNGGFDYWPAALSVNIPAGAAGSGSKQSPLTNYWDIWAINDSSITAARDTGNPDPSPPSGYNVLVNVNTVQANDYVEIGQTIDKTSTLSFDGVIGSQFSVSARIKQISGGVQVAFRFLYMDSAGVWNSNLGPWLPLTTGTYLTMEREGVQWITTLNVQAIRMTIAFKGVGQVALDNVMVAQSVLAPSYRPSFPATPSYSNNMIPNGSFESWPYGTAFNLAANTLPPFICDGWKPYIPPASSTLMNISRNTANLMIGSRYSLLASVTVSAPNYPQIYQALYLDPATDPMGTTYKLRGRIVTASVWVKTAVPNGCTISITDGVNATATSAPHTGDNQWQLLSATYYWGLNSGNGNITIRFLANGAYYVDNCSFVVGSSPVDFIPQIIYPDLITNSHLALDVSRGNLLTNGGFKIWQRGTGPFTVSNAYTADQWFLNPGGGSTISCQRVTTVTANGGDGDFGANLSYTYASAGGQLQTLRFTDKPGLRGKTLTLSARVYAQVASAVQLMITGDGTGAVAAVSASHSGNSTYETLSVTYLVPGDGTFIQCYVPYFVASASTVYVQNACLIGGSGPADYVPMHPVEDLNRCLRYYEIIGNGYGNLVGPGVFINTTQMMFNTRFQIRKAGTPTLTIIPANLQLYSVPASSYITATGSSPAFTTPDSHIGLVTVAAQAAAIVGQASYLLGNASGNNLVFEVNP